MRKIDRFEQEVLKNIKKHNMISENDRVLVGLSGGKDSVALLFALNRLRDIIKFDIVSYHLNHMIRGEEADSDCEFSKRFSEELGIEFFSSSVDVPKEAENSDLGVEAVARNVRYSEFLRISEESGCNKIATAHTVSDNTETAFISLLRNGNMKGIPAVRGNIIRPLITLSTEDVIAYCEENGLEFVTDSTNLDDSYVRNKIRRSIIPSIKEEFPHIDSSVYKFTSIQSSCDALTRLELDRYLASENDPLSIEALKKLALSKAHYGVLYLFFSDILRDKGCELTFPQLDGIIDLIVNGSSGRCIEVQKNISVKREYDHLSVVEAHNDKLCFSFPLMRGENKIDGSNVRLFFETREEFENRVSKNELKSQKFNKLTKNNFIKYNIIDSKPIVRNKIDGDSLLCRGITRSLKKFFIDEKIPSKIRSGIPVVCDEEGIVWVAGLGFSDRVWNAQSDEYPEFSLSIEIKEEDV